MSEHITIKPVKARQELDSLRSSIEALKTSFANDIEGENDLDMVTAFNEIRQEYEELLDTISTLFLENVQSADDAVGAMEETDQKIAGAIKLE